VDSRIAGLELRSKPTGVRWSMRSRLRGRQKRYDLGPAVAGDADLGGVCLNGARAQAIRIAKLTSDGQNPETFLAALETQLRVEAARPTLLWNWETAKANFLADVERRRRALCGRRLVIRKPAQHGSP
jgi:hypothetical protein